MNDEEIHRFRNLFYKFTNCRPCFLYPQSLTCCDTKKFEIFNFTDSTFFELTEIYASPIIEQYKGLCRTYLYSKHADLNGHNITYGPG